MSEVRVAPNAGFCFGVERAVELAVSAIEEGFGPVYTLGPIIHNPQVVERLREKGLMMAESLEEIQEGTVIIRSHGAPKGIIEEASSRNLKVIDATCPLVNRLKDRVMDLVSEGYNVVIVGDSDHPEVSAILSFAGPQCFAVKNVEELLDRNDLSGKVGLVAQTTQSLKNLQEVAAHLVITCSEIRVYQTTCHSTNTRSAEAREMAREVDVMVVVGGKNSSNTRRLADAAADEGATTYHIESAEELAQLDLPKNCVFGVTAGASTPSWIIDEVVAVLKRLE